MGNDWTGIVFDLLKGKALIDVGWGVADSGVSSNI